MTRARIGGVTQALAVGLMICLALGAALLALRTVSAAVEQADRARSALTVRVISPTTPAAIEAATAVMRRVHGVRSATQMDGDRAAQLLEQYSGGPVDPDSLPAAYLIEVRLAPDALRDSTKIDIGDRLGEVGVEAEIYDAGPALARAGRTKLIAAIGASLAVLLLGAAVVVVSRAGALAKPEMALLVADLGGRKPDVLAKYGRSGAEMGFAAGGVAAMICLVLVVGFLVVADPEFSLAAFAQRIGPIEILIFFAAPLLAAALCALGARAGAGRVFAAAEHVG